VARELTVRALILSAGKSTRLGGKQKLLVTAGGIPVHEWHRRALTDYKTAVVVRPEDDAEVAATLTWADRIVPHGKTDGPVGAIAAYLRLFDDDTELLVVYADTLIPAQPLPSGDWVGVSPLTDRTWDYQNKYGVWTRGELPAVVCIGLYRFTDLHELRRAISELGGKEDHHLPDLLNLYQARVYTTQAQITGWHDAGDPAALARVPQVL
jgi:hypothetical protein